MDEGIVMGGSMPSAVDQKDGGVLGWIGRKIGSGGGGVGAELSCHGWRRV